jgi:hypothetical protein
MSFFNCQKHVAVAARSYQKKLPTSRDRRSNGSRDYNGTMGISDFCM